ncbi:DUF4179 domain-containing protein [Paenibacillus filicis]|uniref:DUF4179 domain-containing protein n=1 Tax=Paenibacillus filicis TaxID=669464 RepID=A0ABU9DDX4_9BACL
MVNQFLDDKLTQAKSTLPEQLPQTVRSRLDETYKMIEQMEAPEQPTRRTKKEKKPMKLIHKLSIIISAAAVMGVAVIGSGFISPVMAETLSKIPNLNGLFAKWGYVSGDIGLEQADEYAVNVGKTVTQDGLSIHINNAVFDGTRIVMELATPGNTLNTVTVPEPGAGNRMEPPVQGKGALEEIQAIYQGQPLILSAAIENDNPSKMLLNISNFIDPQHTGNPSYQTVQFPKKIDLTLKVKLKDYNTPFNLVLPLTQTADKTTLASNEVKSFEHINLKIDKLDLTPITTQLDIRYVPGQGQSIADMLAAIPKTYKGSDGNFLILQYEVVDDQGVALRPVGLMVPQVPITTLTFEPFKTKPKFVTIKPYLNVPTGEPAKPDETTAIGNVLSYSAPTKKVYVSELELTLQVK